MIFICAVGMEWETKAQNFLLAIIVAAIFNFIIGSVLGPSGPQQQQKQAQGFIGFSSKFCVTKIESALFYYHDAFFHSGCI